MDVKLKIFISSVQREFAQERKALAAYIREDPMLGDFFEVFLFEEQPARSRSAQAVYLDDYIYRAHDSIPRNRLIARAMSWTSYVEKSGSGTGVIVDKCVEQGLSRPDFDPTVGFFKTVIWREGTQSAPSRGTKLQGPSQGGPSRRGPVSRAESRHPVKAPSQGTQLRHPVGVVGRQSIYERVIAFCEVPRSTKELLEKVGRSDRSKFKRFVMRILLEDGVVEYTIPDKPNSRLQKYRLTAKGRALAAKNAKRSAN